MKKHINKQPRWLGNASAVVEIALRLSGTTQNILRGRSRQYKPVAVRQVLMVVLCENLGLSQSAAARAIGRQASNLSRSIPVARHRIETEPVYRDLYEQILNELGLGLGAK